MTALVRARPTVLARVHVGHWIVDCPVCRWAGARDFGTPVTDCRDCGTSLAIHWPSDDMRRGIERLLMLRPFRDNRNWFPGETLHDLLAENVEHGIGPKEDGQLMLIQGDRIEQDTLPKPVRRLQIGA